MNSFFVPSTLLINSKLSFQTTAGALCTLIFCCFVASITVFLSIDYMNNSKYYKDVAILEMSTNFKDFSLEIMISFPKLYMNSTRILLGDDLSNFELISPCECTDAQYLNFTRNTKNESLFYHCQSFSEINRAFYYSFLIITCSTLKSPMYWMIPEAEKNCEKDPESQWIFEAEFWEKHLVYEISESGEFLSKISIITDKLPANGHQIITGNYNRLRLDDNLLFIDYKELYYSKLIPKVVTNNTKALFSLDIGYEQFYETTLTRYKFINLLANIWGFWNFIYIACYFINQILAKYYFQQFLVKSGFLDAFSSGETHDFIAPTQKNLNYNNNEKTDDKNDNNIRKNSIETNNLDKNANNINNNKLKEEPLTMINLTESVKLDVKPDGNTQENFPQTLNFVPSFDSTIILCSRNQALDKFRLIFYLLSLIPLQCIRRHRLVRDTINLKKKILSRISLENYLLNASPDFLVQRNSLEKKLKKKKSKLHNFLLFFDFFGQKKSLLLNARPFLISWLSIVLLTIKILVFLGIFFLFGRNLWERNPEITVMTKNMVNLPENSYIDPIPCRFTVSRNFAKSSLLTRLDKETGDLKPFNYSVCFENATLISYCFHLSDASGDIFGNNVDNLQTELYFVDCVNLYSMGLGNSSCESFETSANEPIYMNFSYISHNYDLKEVYNYRVDEAYSLETTLNYSQEQRSFFVLKMIPKYLANDRNIMITEINYDVALTTNKFQIALQEFNRRGCFTGLYVEIAYGYLEIQRTYAKIPIIFSYIWTLTMICCLPLLAINGFFKDYFFLNKLSQVFEVHAHFFKSLSIDFYLAKKKIRECLSIKNYLRTRLFFWRKYDEASANLLTLKKAISFENIPLLISGQVNDSNLIKPELKRCALKKFDLLTCIETPFSIKKKWRFKTLFGGVLSILFVASCVVIVFFYGKNYLQKINPKINIQNTPALDLQGKYDYIFNIPFIFGVSKTFDQVSTTDAIHLARGMPKICEKNKFVNFNIQKINETMQYYCMDIADLFGVNLFNGSGYFLNILSTYLNCDVKNSSCPIPNIDYEVFFALNFTLFNMNNYKNYLTNYIVNFYELDKPYDIPYIAYFFQQNILLDDKNEFFNEITDTEYFTTCFFFQAVKYAQMWQKQGSFEFKFYLSNSVILIKRSFEKFPDFLVQIITMIHIALAFFKIVSYLWGDYCFFVYIFKIVKEKMNLEKIDFENEENKQIYLEKLCCFKTYLLSTCCPCLQKYSKDIKNFLVISKLIDCELGVENLIDNLLGKKYEIVLQEIDSRRSLYHFNNIKTIS